jgi:hypothetical protein
MSKQYFGEAYGLKPPENYERFLSPPLAGPWQMISFVWQRFVQANGYWMLLVVPVLWCGSPHNGSVPAELSLDLMPTPEC